jgi:hypothetical protein
LEQDINMQYSLKMQPLASNSKLIESMNFIKKVLVLSLLLIGTQTFAQDPHTDSGLMKGIVQEVLQVSSYTYLNV